MHVGSLTSTNEQFEFVGDLEWDFPLPPAPTNEVIQIIEEIEDGTREPVLKLKPYKYVVNEPENIKLFIAIRFMRLSIVRVEMVDAGVAQLPKKKRYATMAVPAAPMATDAIPDFHPDPEPYYEPEDFDQEEED